MTIETVMDNLTSIVQEELLTTGEIRIMNLGVFILRKHPGGTISKKTVPVDFPPYFTVSFRPSASLQKKMESKRWKEQQEEAT